MTDLLISISLGRPPALYDLDCTVPYKTPAENAAEATDALDDVLQVLTITEQIVEEVYGGQRKVSLRLTRQISRQLKAWSDQRMPRLNGLVRGAKDGRKSWLVSGACHALATYYYAVMLLARPFLMYEAYQAAGKRPAPLNRTAASIGRRTLAEGCVDSACCLIELVSGVVQNEDTRQKMPLLM